MTDGANYAVALSDLCSGHAALRPPRRVSVSEGAAKNLIIKQPGTAGGEWSAEETPYMVEPMDTLASREHEAVVVVGPARTGKTLGLLIGWLAHVVVNDPGDMLFLQMTKDKAREFSKTDVDRALTHSPNVAAMKSGREVDSNTFDTMFRHGMWLRIAWPTVSNVSGSAYRYVAITDLDRIPDAENIGGEGPLFDLARKRTTTFLSRGMTLAESSPGIEVTDPSWEPASPHEAPPVTGILGLYNRCDRRRWYWQCPDCLDHFEAKPGLSLFNLPPDDELLETVRGADIEALAKQYGARIVCPCCSCIIPAKQKTKLNAGGRWLSEGQTIAPDGTIVGQRSQAKMVGYWLGGVAAAYQSWESLVLRYLQGLRDYALTGSEETLKATVTTDQGLPYTSRHLLEHRNTADSPQDRAEQTLQRYIVPEDTRCLIASADVQGGVTSRFVVQIHAVGPRREQWLVDRFDIKQSMREGMGEEFAPIDPASHPEDWDVLTEKLLRATWRTPLADREIKIKLLVVDSGGEDGVSDAAYAWYRRVRKLKMGNRVRLYKGASAKGAPVLKESMVGRRNTKEKGDIPLLVCNPNLISDIVDAGLRRQSGGAGYIHFPQAKHPTKNPAGWLPQSFFDELTAEVRGKNGIWAQIRKRNEAFDLCRMIAAGLLYLKLDKVQDWDTVPSWLAPLDRNSEVITTHDRRDMKANTPVPVAEVPAVVHRQQSARPVRQRRTAASPYIR